MPIPSPGQLGDAPFRDAKRRGEGWLAGRADIGWSNSLGWYEGFRLLVAVDPTGVADKGFGFCAASIADQPLAETFFAVRYRPNPGLSSVGSAFTSGPYVAYSRASRAKRTTGAGSIATERESSTRPSATAANPGPRTSGGGWPASVR
jgi:hypothetical protein